MPVELRQVFTIGDNANEIDNKIERLL